MLLYNNQLLTEDELRLPLSNRAFQYNDGFFETIIIRKGKLSFWKWHIQRMKEASEALKLQLPDLFFFAEFEHKLLDLASRQQALQHGRLKLKVWRSGAGIYTPETNEIGWLATVQSAMPLPDKYIQVGVCKQVKTLYSPLSHFKGPNAPLYVLAGMEKKERAKDDMLLLDHNGAIAEFISSNVFWIKDGKLYTPPLTSGCINGVLRRGIFDWAQKQQIEVTESQIGVAELLKADLVFSANVTGFRIISQIEENALPKDHLLLKQLREGLFG